MNDELTVADFLRITLAILSIMVGAILLQEDGSMSDFMGAVFVVAGILYLVPASRRYLVKWMDRIVGVIRNP